MSLITRCPACATTFKVVPDQLRISDGWVRCGQCTEVFDANAHLLSATDGLEAGPGGATSAPPLSGAPRATRAEPPAFLRATPERHTAAPPAPSAPKASPTPPATPPVPPPAPTIPAAGGAAVAPALRPAPRPADPPARSREPVMPELILPGPGTVTPPPPSPLPTPTSTPSPAPAPARSADELLAEQLARLDLDLAAPSSRALHEPLSHDEGPAFDLEAVFAVEPAAAPEPEIQLPGLSDAPRTPEPRLRPEGDQFPVLSVPELDLPGTPRPPRPQSPQATLATLSFPGDPEPGPPPPAPDEAEDLLLEQAFARSLQAELESPPQPRREPVLKEAVAPEVSASLLSESVGADLAPPWEAAQPLQAASVAAAPAPSPEPAPAPPRRAEDEVDAFGADALQGLQFLRRARREAFWRRPLVRAGLGASALLLSLLLVLQWVLHERNRLAAAEPSLRPALLALCELAGCEITPLRRIESFLIESSAFNKTQGEAYQFALTVHNTGGLPLAMPAAELSLTDSQDQVVLRRVFLPAELGAPAQLGAGAEWSTTQPVALAASAGLRIAGYRVLVFYP